MNRGNVTWNLQSTDGKNTIECYLILPRSMQTPDHRNRKQENDEVTNHIEDLVDDEELVPVKAPAVDTFVPVGL